MGEKGNIVDTGLVTGIGSGMGSTTDHFGTPGDDTSSGTHATGVPGGAAKLAAQQVRDQLTDQAGQRSGVEGIALGTDKPSETK